jgi:hypothetical protein
MTVQPNLLSTGITNLNASPRVRNTSGKPGGPGRLVIVTDTLPAMTTGDTAGGIMRVIRIPSNCIVKKVAWAADATVTTVDCDVGLYYSNTNDGTGAANVAAAATPIDADFFASAVDMKTISTAWQEITFESGVYLPSKAGQPIWQAVGLASDPGGFFDVTFTNTSTTSGAPVLSCKVEYIQPN